MEAHVPTRFVHRQLQTICARHPRSQERGQQADLSVRLRGLAGIAAKASGSRTWTHTGRVASAVSICSPFLTVYTCDGEQACTLSVKPYIHRCKAHAPLRLTVYPIASCVDSPVSRTRLGEGPASARHAVQRHAPGSRHSSAVARREQPDRTCGRRRVYF